MTRKEELKVLMDGIRMEIRSKTRSTPFYWIGISPAPPEEDMIDAVEKLIVNYRKYEKDLELIEKGYDFEIVKYPDGTDDNSTDR